MDAQGLAEDFIDRAHRDQRPFFVWFNPTRMHHLDPAQAGVAERKPGVGVYPDGMVENDGQVGQLLEELDDLGIANDTIVIFTS